MPDYPTDVGISDFLKRFSTLLLSNYERDRQQQDKMRKMEAERAVHAADAGRLMFQAPTQPVPGSLDLIDPAVTGIGRYAESAKMNFPTGPTALPSAVTKPPKPQPLSIAEQIALRDAQKAPPQNLTEEQIKAVYEAKLRGKAMPKGVESVAPEIQAIKTGVKPKTDNSEGAEKPQPKFKIGDKTAQGKITKVTWNSATKKYEYEVK